jgi:hypothetical protein
MRMFDIGGNYDRERQEVAYHVMHRKLRCRITAIDRNANLQRNL